MRTTINTKTKNWTTLALLCLIILQSPFAQSFKSDEKLLQLPTKNISKKDGLTNLYIRALCQDSRGFLWFGTQDGLHRYDGYSFVKTNTSSRTASQLKNNVVNTLLEDRDGNIWIGTAGGLDKLYFGADTISHYQTNNQNISENLSIHKNINLGEVRELIQDSIGRIWIALYGGGLNCFDPKTNMFTYYIKKKEGTTGLSTNLINGLYFEKDGTLWIATEQDGVYKMNVYTDNDVTKIKSTKNYTYTTILKDKNRRYWFGSWGEGLMQYNPSNGELTTFKFGSTYADNAIRAILEDTNNKFWLGGFRSGMYLFDRTTKEYLNTKADEKNLQGIGEKTVWTLMQDRSDCIWAGTWGDGLYKFCPTKNQFKTEIFHDKSSLNKITSFLEANSECYWIGTETNGLFNYNIKTKALLNFKEGATKRNYPNNIRNIFKDSQSEIWICGDGGLVNYNTKTNTFKEIIKTQPPIANIYSICEQDADHLWLGSMREGLYLINKRDGSYKNFRYEPNNDNCLTNNVIWDLFNDDLGNLWIATDSGLDKYNLTTNKFTHCISSKSISKICPSLETSTKTLWLGSFDLGIIKYTITTNKAEYLFQNTNLEHKGINGLTMVGKELWIGYDDGFARFNTENNNTEIFSKDPAISENEYSYNAFYLTSNQQILAGGTNGFTIFNPAEAKKRAFTPKVILTDFLLFNKKVVVNEVIDNRIVLDTTIAIKNHLTLNYYDYIFSLEFASDDFTNPDNIEYAYILEGFEKNWNFTDAKRRFIAYTNLKPGNYTLKIKSTNSDGVWFNNARTLNIEVLPPFWNTWWAYTFYILLLAFLLFLFRRAVQNRERFKNELNLKVQNAEHQQEIEKGKLNFFTNVSHEFRTPLTLIQGPLEKLLDEIKDEKTTKQLNIISRNSKRLLNLINQILDFSKIDSGNLHLNLINEEIVTFTQKIFQTFEDEAIKKNISYAFKQNKKTFYTSFDPDKYEIIIYNLLSNAFKYTNQGGKIELILEITPSREEENLTPTTQILKISVIDKGIGISADKLNLVFQRFYQVEDGNGGTGIGLAFTKELVELYKGKIWVESNVNEGAAFYVEIPLKEKNASEARSGDVLTSSIKTEQNNDTTTSNDSDDLEYTSGATIVLAEDNSDMRNFIASSLSKEFKVIEAENGKEAWLSIIKSMPDIVISDVMMPEKDGLELCKQIKSNELTSHIPVILLTARAAEENFVQGLKHGADFYISKPFSPKLLKAQVISLLNNRKILKERFLKKLDILPEEFTTNQLDQEFYFRITNIIEKNLENPDLSIDYICNQMAVSRTHLYTKIKAISGQSGSDFIRIIRLKHAGILIKDGHKVTKVFAMVGFKTQPHFTRSFKEHFGVSPTDFAKLE